MPLRKSAQKIQYWALYIFQYNRRGQAEPERKTLVRNGQLVERQGKARVWSAARKHRGQGIVGGAGGLGRGSGVGFIRHQP